MIRVPATFECNPLGCGTIFRSPSQVNEDYDKFPDLPDGVLEQNMTTLEDSTEITIRCPNPNCNRVIYSWNNR